MDFATAAEKVRELKKPASDEDRIELYSLYKQATVGDVNTALPDEEEAKAKWDAWEARKGTSQDEAKEKYISLAQKLIDGEDK